MIVLTSSTRRFQSEKWFLVIRLHTIAVLNVIPGYTRQENANVKCECCPWGPLAAFINTVLIVVFTGENLEYEKWIRGFSLMWKVIKLGGGGLVSMYPVISQCVASYARTFCACAPVNFGARNNGKKGRTRALLAASGLPTPLVRPLNRSVLAMVPSITA